MIEACIARVRSHRVNKNSLCSLRYWLSPRLWIQLWRCLPLQWAKFLTTAAVIILIYWFVWLFLLNILVNYSSNICCFLWCKSFGVYFISIYSLYLFVPAQVCPFFCFLPLNGCYYLIIYNYLICTYCVYWMLHCLFLPMYRFLFTNKGKPNITRLSVTFLLLIGWRCQELNGPLVRLRLFILSTIACRRYE